MAAHRVVPSQFKDSLASPQKADGGPSPAVAVGAVKTGGGKASRTPARSPLPGWCTDHAGSAQGAPERGTSAPKGPSQAHTHRGSGSTAPARSQEGRQTPGHPRPCDLSHVNLGARLRLPSEPQSTPGVSEHLGWLSGAWAT